VRLFLVEPERAEAGRVKSASYAYVAEADKGNREITKWRPLAVDFATSPENRQDHGELIYSSETFRRPYMLRPNVPADRVVALRKDFIAANEGPGFARRTAHGSASHRTRSRASDCKARADIFRDASAVVRKGQRCAGVSGPVIRRAN